MNLNLKSKWESLKVAKNEFEFGLFLLFSDHAPTCDRKMAKFVLWFLRTFSPGIMAFEPAIRAELVIEQSKRELKEEVDLTPEEAKDPFGIHEVCLFVCFEFDL
jgi:hypothetical protein